MKLPRTAVTTQKTSNFATSTNGPQTQSCGRNNWIFPPPPVHALSFAIGIATKYLMKSQTMVMHGVSVILIEVFVCWAILCSLLFVIVISNGYVFSPWPRFLKFLYILSVMDLYVA